MTNGVALCNALDLFVGNAALCVPKENGTDKSVPYNQKAIVLLCHCDLSAHTGVAIRSPLVNALYSQHF